MNQPHTLDPNQPAHDHQNLTSTNLNTSGHYNGLGLTDAVQLLRDTLHAEALADDAARTADKAADLAAYVAQQNAASAPAHTLTRADFLDSDLISGMFTAMNHAEIYGTDREFAYGEQEIVSFADEDFTPMFDLS